MNANRVADAVILGAAWFCVAAFMTAMAAILSVLAAEGDMLPGSLFVVAALIAVAVFSAGLLMDNRWLVAGGWTGMLVSLVPLISFAFVLLPLLLAASPALFLKRG